MPQYNQSKQNIGELFLAGEHVPPGTYKQIGCGRELRFDEDGLLPTGSDGQVSCYVCIRSGWSLRLVIQEVSETSL